MSQAAGNILSRLIFILFFIQRYNYFKTNLEHSREALPGMSGEWRAISHADAKFYQNTRGSYFSVIIDRAEYLRIAKVSGSVDFALALTRVLMEVSYCDACEISCKTFHAHIILFFPANHFDYCFQICCIKKGGLCGHQ